MLEQHSLSLPRLYPESAGKRLLAIIQTVMKASWGFNRMHAVLMMCNRHNERAPLTLPEALNCLRETEAGNPRDKVYSALGLTSDADLVTIDYGLGVSDVLISVTKNWIEATHQLHILGYGNLTTSKSSGVPSWVVDWGNRNNYYSHRWPLYKDDRQVGDDFGNKRTPVCSAGGQI